MDILRNKIILDLLKFKNIYIYINFINLDFLLFIFNIFRIIFFL